jgi:hypothetical protein
MRWDALFADLAGQADRLARAERAAEIEERTRIEAGSITLFDRLRPAVGSRLRVRALGGVSSAGMLRRLGRDWLLIAETTEQETVLPGPAVLSVAGLSRWAAPPDETGPGRTPVRLGLRAALRAIARDRSGVRVHLVDGAIVEGTIDRVGADLIEVAVHERGSARRQSGVCHLEVIPVGALAALRR